MKKGVYIPYNLIVAIVSVGFAFFFGLSIGHYWQSTVFNYILAGGSVIGLGTIFVMIGIPLFNFMKVKSEEKANLTRVIEEVASGKRKQRNPDDFTRNEYEDVIDNNDTVTIVSSGGKSGGRA